MQLSKTRKNILFTFSFTLICIISLLFLSWMNIRSAKQEEKLMNEAISRLDQIEHMMFDLEKIESSLPDRKNSTKATIDLALENGKRHLQEVISKVETMAADEQTLKPDYQVLLNQLARLSSTLTKSAPDEKKLTALMNEIRMQVHEIKSDDWIRLQESSNKNHALYNKRLWQLGGLGAIFILLLSISYLIINRNIRLSREKEKILKFHASTLESVSDAIITTDIENKITGWNRFAGSIFGYQENEAMGKNIVEFLKINADHSRIDEITETIIKSGQWKGELINYGKDNQKIIVEAVCSAIRDEQEKIVGWVNVIRDVTRRVEEERELIRLRNYLEEEVKIKVKELRLSNERFELMSKATNDALWDWDIDNDEMWYNGSYRNLFGVNEQDVFRFNDFIARVVPENKEKLLKKFEQATALKSSLIADEYNLIKADGSLVSIYNRSYILYDTNGKAYRMLGAMQDISHQKSIQQQIVLEKELSDTIINSLPGVFYMFNEKTQMLRWNKNLEKITGYTHEEISTFNPVDFVPEDQQKLVFDKIMSVFTNGEDAVEADLLSRDGNRVPYFFTGLALRYNGENCMLGVGIDVSERKKSQDELRELMNHLQNIREEERGRIAREIHDELGQQLTGLKMDFHWLNKKIGNETSEIKNKISESILLIDETVKTVRRIATQLRPSILDDLGLIPALEWLSEEFEKRYKIITRLSCNTTYTEKGSNLGIGIFRIYQESLTNILRHSNATEVNAQIEIEDDMFNFTIADNGIGFNPDEASTKNTLGLIGIKERTSLMGGTCEINSVAGKGTTIMIKVPVNS